MSILAVPNWSFGRIRELHQQFVAILDRNDVFVQYCQGDPDHNRTVTAFSGRLEDVRRTLFDLADVAFDTIDLNKHVGVHPRIGALDVCPFVPLDGDIDGALDFAEGIARDLARDYDLPIYLYEKSEQGRHEADLPTLRKGGFGSLFGKQLNPDFGPSVVNPRLGVTVLGVRDFLIALNVNLEASHPAIAENLAKQIRHLRTIGDERFLGVRALGFTLESRGQTQVSMNVTMPDITPIDPIIAWVSRAANELGTSVAGAELIGVILARHVSQAQRVVIDERQIVALDSPESDVEDDDLSS